LGLIGHRAVSFARIFQSQPWVAAAVMRMLTWAVRVPLRCYRRNNDPNDRDILLPDDHPIAQMIESPWPGGSQAQLVMNLFGPILVHGNSVTLINDQHVSDGALGATPKDWRYCRPMMPWRADIEGFVFDVDTPTHRMEASIDKVLHISWWSPTGPIGTSPLMQLGVTVQIEDAAQRYQRSLFAYGGRPPTAVTVSDAFLGIKSEERQKILGQLRADLNQIYGGPENSGKPALLPPGLDWKPVGQTTVEAALIDQRKIAREEIAGVYLIPPPMLGILERATYSNIETQREMVYTDCLGPPLILIEQAINAQIIRDLLQEDDVFVEFDFSAVLRGDRLSEIDSIRDAIGTALLSPNEGRGVLSLPGVDNPAMDEYYMPVVNNLQSITSPEEPDATAGIDETVLPPESGQEGPEEAPPQEPGPGAPKGLVVVSGGREYVLTPS
jgi:HK97 family phage portal protein